MYKAESVTRLNRAVIHVPMVVEWTTFTQNDTPLTKWATRPKDTIKDDATDTDCVAVYVDGEVAVDLRMGNYRVGGPASVINTGSNNQPLATVQPDMCSLQDSSLDQLISKSSQATAAHVRNLIEKYGQSDSVRLQERVTCAPLRSAGASRTALSAGDAKTYHCLFDVGVVLDTSGDGADRMVMWLFVDRDSLVEHAQTTGPRYYTAEPTASAVHYGSSDVVTSLEWLAERVHRLYGIDPLGIEPEAAPTYVPTRLEACDTAVVLTAAPHEAL